MLIYCYRGITDRLTCENKGASFARATLSGDNDSTFLFSARFFQNEELLHFLCIVSLTGGFMLVVCTPIQDCFCVVTRANFFIRISDAAHQRRRTLASSESKLPQARSRLLAARKCRPTCSLRDNITCRGKCGTGTISNESKD